MDKDMSDFYRALPKIELHAHLNGSLSRATMLDLQRYHADKGVVDDTNVFFDEFQIGAGDFRNLNDCFQVFNIAHNLTSRPEMLALATKLTLQEFQNDGCVYIELRSTPRDTAYMTKKEYIDTLVTTMKIVSTCQSMMSKLIISVNRTSPLKDCEEIIHLAIENFKTYPDIVVGVELSGNPMIGNFESLKPLFNDARAAGLKVTLHCGEVSNPEEVMEMIRFKPDRIGHGTCIHPNYGGTEETWKMLCDSKIPVEICLTSNVNTKSTTDYDSHHFKELYEAQIPVILCTDDKGVFSTSLSQEYRLCAETFNLSKEGITKIAKTACQYVFDKRQVELLNTKYDKFITEYFPKK